MGKQIHLLIKYVQFIVCQLFLNKTALKIPLLTLLLGKGKSFQANREATSRVLPSETRALQSGLHAPHRAAGRRHEGVSEKKSGGPCRRDTTSDLKD